MLLLDYTNIEQSNIPISTAATTHHVSIFKNILFFKIFKNKIFQTFLGPFPGPQGLTPPFSNSPSPATRPHNFSDVSTSFLASFFTVLPSTSWSSQYFPWFQSQRLAEPHPILLIHLVWLHFFVLSDGLQAFRGSLRQICGGQSGTGAGFSPNTAVFLSV